MSDRGVNKVREGIPRERRDRPPLCLPSTSCATAAQPILYGDLHHYLYNRKEVRAVGVEELQRRKEKGHKVVFWCDICQCERQTECSLHGSSHCQRKAKPTATKDSRASYAIESFPDEVQLCSSGIPGIVYGVCAKCPIPKGTWIGPYEGVKVKPEDIKLGTEAGYMWEVFREGQLAFYLDGSNEDSSSWMRFIRCARNKNEQNLYAFQYLGNIYYRAFQDISPGTELLVWYDDIYPQYMGIPLEIHETGDSEQADSKQDSQVVVVVSPNGSPFSPTKHTKPATSPQASLQTVHPGPFSSSFNPIVPRMPHSSTVTSSTVTGIRPLGYHHEENAIGLLPGLPWQSQLAQIPQNSTGQQQAENISGSVPLLPWQRMNVPAGPHRMSNEVKQRSCSLLGARMHMDEAEDADDEDNGEEDTSLYSVQIPALHADYKESSDEKSDGETETSVKCGQCGTTFPQRSSLQIHVCPLVPYKPYHCGHCTHSFSDPNELRNHAIIHTSEKPFRCGYCSRSFSGATTLNNHIRTHTGEKPFMCDACGKTFSQASQLGRHQKIPGDCIE